MYPYDNYNFSGIPQPNQPYGFNTVPYQSQQQRTGQNNQTNTNKIYVSGIEDVRARMLPAGSDFIFLDNDKPILYQKIVSPSGQFEVKTFTISPYEPQEATKTENSIDLSSYVKTTDLEPIKAELNELKNKLSAKKMEVSNGTGTTTTSKSI